MDVLPREGLVPPAFELLPLGVLRPEGWLEQQLRIQADGLSGHLDEFWPDVADSGWLGGEGEGWERAPYWLDGLIPLAFLLDDQRLIDKAHAWMDYILSHQDPDGWLGPRQDEATGRYAERDPWPVSVFLKALMQYHSATGDERIIPAMTRFYEHLDTLLDVRTLFDWGRMRWAELVLGLHWLHGRTQEPWLLRLAQRVHEQGYDWDALFDEYPYQDRTEREEIDMTTHVVNNAMAIKSAGVWYRQTGQFYQIGGVYRMIDLLEAYHGQVTGVFTGDEHLAGKNPSQGTELCAVVEYLFSLQVLLSIIGDPKMADRMERIAFNALPAAFKPDMWAHQYDQQVNQPVCRIVDDPIYTNNAPESNIYGLEPNYGCCTANMHQGWPKFAASLWMRVPAAGDSPPGLAAVCYAPCRVETELDGVSVHLDVETDYPFGEGIEISITVSRPVSFPLMLRIPRWTRDAVLRIGDQQISGLSPGAFYRHEREWEGTTQISLSLSLPVRVEERYRGSAAILKGPLVFSLQIGEAWHQIGGEEPHADWEVHPTTPWNYGLVLDRDNPKELLRFERREMGEKPFSPKGVPLVAYAQARRVRQWEIEQGTAGPIPSSPVETDEPIETVTLLPYGATNLRITEFPTVEPKQCEAKHTASKETTEPMP